MFPRIGPTELILLAAICLCIFPVFLAIIAGLVILLTRKKAE